jgi:tetratricopeptide (TPR) repeat protein
MPESAKKPLVIFTYVVLILSTLLVFWQVHNFDFVTCDDNNYVFENPHVLGGLAWANITWAFLTGHAANWHPLTWLSLMLDCQLFGPRPGWMHLTNLLLHLANVLLLFVVLKKMTGSLWSAAFVAAAFALHPMHVESVAWIAERKDVLSTFFLLLTLAAYISYVKRRSLARYFLTILLFVLGLLAKPMLVTVPLLLLLLDYWPLNRFDLQPVKASGSLLRTPTATHSGLAALYRLTIEKIPFFVLSVGSSIITFLVQRAGGAVVDTTVIPLYSRVANAFLSYGKYVGKLFWPQDLAVFYPLGSDSSAFWQVVTCAGLLLVISILVVRYRHRQRYLPVGWFWFVAALVPVIGLVQVGDQSYADRYTYIPYIGLFIMVAWGLPELLSKWPQRKLILGVSAAVGLVASGVCAHQQTGYWKNSFTLFTHAIEVTRNNYLAYNNRGAAYGNLGRLQEAANDLSQAIAIKPDYADVHNDLGATYAGLGRWQEAINAHKQAIRLRPDFAQAYNDLGAAYAGLGRGTEAIDAYGQAIKLNPDYIAARCNLANTLIQQGRSGEAVSQYRAVLRLKPDWPDCMNNLAFIIATGPDIKDHDANEAVALAARACKLTKDRNPAYLDTLAAAYASVGRFGEAVDTVNKAISLAADANQPQLKSIIQQHLTLYKQGKPYIEPAPKPLPDSNKP